MAEFEIFEFQGLSMAPWLMPRDLVFVDTNINSNHLCLGDIVLVENSAGEKISHRIVRRTKNSQTPFVLKGDRVPYCDDLSAGWQIRGKVVFRIRSGVKAPLPAHWLLAKLSVWGLYPGQRIPAWASRARIKKLFRIVDHP